MKNKPRAFIKKRIGISGGEAKIKDGPTYLHYNLDKYCNLKVHDNPYDRLLAIEEFGSIENLEKWRENQIKKIKKQMEKRNERELERDKNPATILTFSKQKLHRPI